ncbi:MAG: hypothetical protein ACREM1_20250 [Longimicrobiales bacterium]
MVREALGEFEHQVLLALLRSTMGSRHQGRLQSMLVATEIAMSLVLLVGAGLLLRSFAQVLGADRGFETESAGRPCCPASCRPEAPSHWTWFRRSGKNDPGSARRARYQPIRSMRPRMIAV